MSKIAAHAVSVALTAVKLLDARPGRKEVRFETMGQPVHIGADNSVTASNGFPVGGTTGAGFPSGPPLENVTSEIWGIVTGSTVSVRILEIYDE